MTDLELLHNYTTTTYLTLTESSVSPALLKDIMQYAGCQPTPKQSMREFYRTTIVQVGLSCDYIMRAILSVSSLHLAHYRPHMRDRYEAIAITHHQAASQVAIPLISDATAQSAQMLFVFSVLTIYYGESLCGRRTQDTSHSPFIFLPSPVSPQSQLFIAQ